jgi:hypothetical protein
VGEPTGLAQPDATPNAGVLHRDGPGTAT